MNNASFWTANFVTRESAGIDIYVILSVSAHLQTIGCIEGLVQSGNSNAKYHAILIEDVYDDDASVQISRILDIARDITFFTTIRRVVPNGKSESSTALCIALELASCIVNRKEFDQIMVICTNDEIVQQIETRHELRVKAVNAHTLGARPNRDQTNISSPDGQLLLQGQPDTDERLRQNTTVVENANNTQECVD